MSTGKRRKVFMRKWFVIAAAMVSGAVATAPVSAQNASFSGSATVINPSFFTSTVSAERVAPQGTDFLGGTNFTVTPTYGNVGFGIFTPSTVAIDSLELGAGGALTTAPLTPPTTFTAAAADALNQAAAGSLTGDIEAVTAIIRAGAGVDGLE
jgi:hypothetical protein